MASCSLLGILFLCVIVFILASCNLTSSRLFLVRLMTELVAHSLILHESTQSLQTATKILVTFAIFARFEGFWRPLFAMFLSKSRIFVKFVILAIFAIFHTFSMLLRSRKYPCYFCDFFLSLEFCFIGYYCYSCDICKWWSHKIFDELFSLRKLWREFANKIVPGHIYRSFFSFTVIYALPRHIIQTGPSNKAAGEVKHYHNLVLTDPSVLGISMASAL